MEPTFRVNPPVPLGFALEGTRWLGLTLKFDDKVLEEMGDFGTHTFSTERQAAVILTLVLGKVRKKLEEEPGYMGSLSGSVAIRVRHLDHQLDSIAVVEEDLDYSQFDNTSRPAGRPETVLAAPPEPARHIPGVDRLILSRRHGRVKWLSDVLSPNLLF